MDVMLVVQSDTKMGEKTVAWTEFEMVGTLADSRVEKLAAQSVAETVVPMAGLKVVLKDDKTAAMTGLRWVVY